MQNFKHKNTYIWIWKFCLLKIYLDYRELMNTSWLTEYVWLKLMNTTDWMRKIARDKNFKLLIFHYLKLSLFHLFKLFCLFCTLPNEEGCGSIYRWWSQTWIYLESSILKILKSITCRDSCSNEVCRGRTFFLFLVRDSRREKILFVFPFSTLLAK